MTYSVSLPCMDCTPAMPTEKRRSVPAAFCGSRHVTAVSCAREKPRQESEVRIKSLPRMGLAASSTQHIPQEHRKPAASSHSGQPAHSKQQAQTTNAAIKSTKGRTEEAASSSAHVKRCGSSSGPMNTVMTDVVLMKFVPCARFKGNQQTKQPRHSACSWALHRPTRSRPAPSNAASAKLNRAAQRAEPHTARRKRTQRNEGQPQQWFKRKGKAVGLPRNTRCPGWSSASARGPQRNRERPRQDAASAAEEPSGRTRTSESNNETEQSPAVEPTSVLAGGATWVSAKKSRNPKKKETSRNRPTQQQRQLKGMLTSVVGTVAQSAGDPVTNMQARR